MSETFVLLLVATILAAIIAVVVFVIALLRGVLFSGRMNITPVGVSAEIATKAPESNRGLPETRKAA